MASGVGMSDGVYTGIGRSIKYWRKMRAHTQKQLCQGICSQAELSKIENDLNDPNAKIIYLLAQRLDIPVGKLFEDWGKEDDETK